MRRISPSELAAFLGAHPDAIVVDVREPFENELCQLPAPGVQSALIPMSRLAVEFDERVPDLARPVLLYCHHGIRSLHAAAFLEQLGYESVQDLRGGIDAYSLEVDPSVPRY